MHSVEARGNDRGNNTAIKKIRQELPQQTSKVVWRSGIVSIEVTLSDNMHRSPVTVKITHATACYRFFSTLLWECPEEIKYDGITVHIDLGL
eukprot:m.1086980 g.1086980  ORF g.1086980 m.1086980 type:complete len:92 (+) comp24282_c0_seq1:3158-3433(+)